MQNSTAQFVPSDGFSGLKIEGSQNVLLVNSRPALNGKDAVLLHFRELEGVDSNIVISSLVDGRPVKSFIVVNAMGKKVPAGSSSIHFTPFEVKFIELEF